jgi:hypothetical protein
MAQANFVRTKQLGWNKSTVPGRLNLVLSPQSRESE